MNCIVYKLNDFDQIKRNGISYSLPQETIDIIKQISANVGAPEYVKTPHFEKKTIKHTSSRYQSHPQPTVKDTTLDNWNAVRNFKPTVMEKKKGIELSVDKIRKSLNKITDKTYEKMLLQIIEEIDLILKENGMMTTTNPENEGQVELVDENVLSELTRIGDSIFDIASGNAFYSKMYAKMSKVLMDNYAFMNDIFKNKINNEIDLFSDYAYCSPDSDYDQFCKNNKLNEKRRSLGLFYINLMQEGIMEKDKIILIIETIQHDLIQEMVKENNSNIVEEMSEFIYIMIMQGACMLNQSTTLGKWKEIVDRVNVISIKKHKSEPSITNKTIFKHLDIMAFVNKK